MKDILAKKSDYIASLTEKKNILQF